MTVFDRKNLHGIMGGYPLRLVACEAGAVGKAWLNSLD